MKSSWCSTLRGYRRYFPRSLFITFQCEIRVLPFGLVCELEYMYGISKYDSESFELELNGIPGWWHLW